MATTCLVTATITDPSQTSLLGNSFIRFRLRNFEGFIPIVTGANVVCESQIDAYPNPAGAISQTIICNTAISPINTFYTVEFWNQGRPVSSANYVFNANTSLNTASNLNPAPAPTGTSAIIFENNGVLNSSQTLLNLESTDASVTITDVGAGTLNLQASTGGISGAGAGFFGPGITSIADIFNDLGVAVSAGTAGGVVAANVLGVYLFELLTSFTIGKVTTSCGSSNGGVTANFGIYSFAGNKLVDSGGFTCLASSGMQVLTFSPVTLPAGKYWHAQATTSGSAPVYFGVGVASGGSTPSVMAAWVKNNTRAATAANTLSGTLLPATLGTLTPFTPSNANGDGVCCPLWET